MQMIEIWDFKVLRLDVEGLDRGKAKNIAINRDILQHL